MTEKREVLQALRVRYSELVGEIFNTPFNTKEYQRLFAEADVILGKIQRLSFKNIPTLTIEDFKE